MPLERVHQYLKDMSNVTVTFSETSKGWPSFYTYYPDYIQGMNQFLYTFKGGNLYQHNSDNVSRNNYYGVQGESKITSVFNESPLDNKKFKTLVLEGDDSWSAQLSTDLQTNGFINASYFEQKESDWFAFVRNNSTNPAGENQYAMRSLTGIGDSTTANNDATTATISFNLNLGSIISVGDQLFFADNTPPVTTLTPQFCGQITSVTYNPALNISTVILDNQAQGAVPIPSQNFYFLYIKDAVAESQGVLGHYCLFELTNDSTVATELFAVKSEAFKRYP